MSQRRVVITGAGLISPLGNSPQALWEGLAAGRSGVVRLDSAAAEELPSPFVGRAAEFRGEIEDFGPLEKGLQRTIKKGLKLMCREIEMGVAAAQQALADAGLTAGSFDPERTGVTFGSDFIATHPAEFAAAVRSCQDEAGDFRFGEWHTRGLPQVTPLWLLKYLPNMPASHIAIYNDLRGPSNSITCREASSNLSIAEAYFTIQRDHADVLVAGATGTRVHPIRSVHSAIQEQLARGEDPAKLSRPFDGKRNGMVLGEGSGAVVLELLERDQARGEKLYGEVNGYGSSSVVAGGVPDRARALENAFRKALRTAGLGPHELGHIQAHGLSTTSCDREEAAAIGRVLGESRVPVAAAKANFGNLGAGSGAVELIAGLMALAAGTLFPLLNYEQPDAECGIQPATAETSAGEVFVNLNTTPQAQAAALVVRKFA